MTLTRLLKAWRPLNSALVELLERGELPTRECVLELAQQYGAEVSTPADLAQVLTGINLTTFAVLAAAPPGGSV